MIANRIITALTLAVASSAAWGLNTRGFSEAPITRLTEGEVKEYFAAIGKVLDETPDGTTVEWKAPKTPFDSKITPQRSFSDGKLQCREATIESDARDRFQRGVYIFCKGEKGGWQFKLPAKGQSK